MLRHREFLLVPGALPAYCPPMHSLVSLSGGLTPYRANGYDHEAPTCLFTFLQIVDCSQQWRWLVGLLTTARLWTLSSGVCCAEKGSRPICKPVLRADLSAAATKA